MNRATHSVSRAVMAAGFACLLVSGAACRRPEPGTFATPEEAVHAVHAVAGTGDTAKVEEIFGPDSQEMFSTGDPVEDAKAARRIKELIAEKIDFEEHDADTLVALFGAKGWPFPIPLVRQGERWRFDTAAGREELLNRRIGFYELATIASLQQYVEAQREYAGEGRDGKPRAFAQRFRSCEGMHDGLYWPAAEGETPSPLGDLLAEAASEEQQPYRGYHYRILTAQGPDAPGGEKSYLDARGLMTGGFAAVAWPAKYGNSGVMTFLVSQRGIVFQKDLGAETGSIGPTIRAFDPDDSWQPTGDSLLAVGDEGEDAEDDAATQ